MRSTLSGAVTLGLMTALSVGCNRDTERNADQTRTEPTANVPTAPPEAPGPSEGKGEPPAIGGGPKAPAQTTPAGAVARLAATTCDREVRCNHVGPDKKYKTRDECMSKTVTDKSKGINAHACPGGIHESNLNGCVSVIRDAGCGNPMGTLSRWDSCKTDVICVK